MPIPFCRIDLFYGEPLVIAKGIKGEELEPFRLLLEKRLNELYVTAWQLHGKNQH
jgi:hypothetical protein